MPYLISSHPGCTLEDAVQLAEWPEQARAHAGAGCKTSTPTPGTLATCSIGTPAWIPGPCSRCSSPRRPTTRPLQRALMQWRKPQNRKLVLEALHKTGREDLIGYGKRCLIRPDKGQAPSVSPGGKRVLPGGRKPPRAAAKRAGEPERSGTAAAAPWRSRSSPTGRSAKAGWAKPAASKGTKGTKGRKRVKTKPSRPRKRSGRFFFIAQSQR